ncbi:MAG: ATP-binding cassette domain-containing protein [bacterium]|nr:ATP-binding cassette domain-containing protein [bacterium]
MALFSVQGLGLGYGGMPLLEDLGFQIEAGERIALVGRNGSGKSTLLRLLAGELEPDDGQILLQAGCRVAQLDQELPQNLEGDLFDVIAAGVHGVGEKLAEYHHLTADAAELGPRRMARLEQVQHEIEAAGGWHLHQRVETVISRLGLPEAGRFEELSGGLARRVLLARALVAEPDLLLLDEPTNHLDIQAIEWLERFLLDHHRGSLLFVTHDRAFLRRLATRILEIDRGRLSDWPGDYDRYVERKRAALDVEAKQDARFDKKLAQEEAWIRQGIKARRTRDEGRVRALEKLREERRARRLTEGTARLARQDAQRSGKIVIEAIDITHSFTGEPLIESFSTNIHRGDKIGLLGPNGSGKTTLLKILLGELEPGRGRLRHGTRLEVVYFDQHREQLDDDRPVADNVADGADRITVAGKTRHVIGYLQDFLFTPTQSRGPVRHLSGGERNRLLLARLFTRPFNVLVMDEPTNDLDVETLELLEERLIEYDGTLLLVSHDRAFLDNVVTSTLVMAGGGRVEEYVGGYSDWLGQRPSVDEPTRKASRTPSKPRPRHGPRKLSYRERRDLETLPDRIEELEAEQQELHAKMADPALYRRGDGDEIGRFRERLAAVEKELEEVYERWLALEGRQGS